MERKSIATNMAVVSCDVCGRTLLRGENADVFLHGGSRRTVCELCTSRAVHEGWIREGLDGATAIRGGERGRGRTLLHRFRGRRDEREAQRDEEPQFTPPPPPSVERVEYAPAPAAEAPAPPAPAPSAVPFAMPGDPHTREDRHVHAVPTNAELKNTRAVEVFNVSPHPRTVAGVARSLGAPIVAVRPSPTEGSIVTIVVGWELSWYRYEVDLGDEAAGVRLTAQGAELSELDPADQTPNAAAGAHGDLHMVAGVA